MASGGSTMSGGQKWAVLIAIILGFAGLVHLSEQQDALRQCSHVSDHEELARRVTACQQARRKAQMTCNGTDGYTGMTCAAANLELDTNECDDTCIGKLIEQGGARWLWTEWARQQHEQQLEAARERQQAADHNIPSEPDAAPASPPLKHRHRR
jgi:hypothetical protein